MPPERVFRVRIDYTKDLIYPDFKREICHPELERKEPNDYNLLTQVELWLNPKQSGYKKTLGYIIYEDLKASDQLQNHLNLADLLAIKAKGVDVFRRLYGNKAVYGWASVIRGDGNYYVPYLCAYINTVVIKWRCLSGTLDALSPALVFKKAK